MADTTALKNRIRAAIKANDNQEITGPVLQQALLDIVDELNNSAESEALIRSNADTALQQGITAEKTRAEEAESTLQQGITAEKTRAEEAESTLQQGITAEKNRAEGAESILRQDITAEKTRAEGVESILRQDITAEKTRAEGVESILRQDITAEKTRAEEAESALQRGISNEVSNRENAFNKLDLIDAAGSEVSPNAIDLTLRKNDGIEDDPDYRTLTHILLPTVTTEKAGLMSTALLALLNSAVNDGYKYKGIATPNTNPGQQTINCFYFAKEAGTYVNFDSLELTAGINILKWNGTVWSVEHLISIDNVPTTKSDNLVKSGGVAAEFKALGNDLNLLTRTGTEIIGTSATNLTVPVDFIAGDIFYINEGTDGGNFSIYVDGIHYYIAKVSGTAGSSLVDPNLFDNAYSSAEAVRLSLDNRDVGKLIKNAEMDEVLGGEVAVYLTDSTGVAVLDDEGKPIEII